MSDLPVSGLQLQSLVTAEGKLELSLADVPVAEPKDHEVVVRVEASPINPSDLGMLLAMADVTNAVQGGSADSPTVSADISPNILKALSARVGHAMPPGNANKGIQRKMACFSGSTRKGRAVQYMPTRK